MISCYDLEKNFVMAGSPVLERLEPHLYEITFSKKFQPAAVFFGDFGLGGLCSIHRQNLCLYFVKIVILLSIYLLIY